MAQIYQEVIAITLNRLVRDKDDKPAQLIDGEADLEAIENIVQSHLDTPGLVVEASKIEE